MQLNGDKYIHKYIQYKGYINMPNIKVSDLGESTSTDNNILLLASIPNNGSDGSINYESKSIKYATIKNDLTDHIEDTEYITVIKNNISTNKSNISKQQTNLSIINKIITGKESVTQQDIPSIDIKTNITTITGDIVEINNNITDHNNRITGNQQSITNIRTDITNISTDINTTDTKLSTTSSNLETLSNNFNNDLTSIATSNRPGRIKLFTNLGPYSVDDSSTRFPLRINEQGAAYTEIQNTYFNTGGTGSGAEIQNEITQLQGTIEGLSNEIFSEDTTEGMSLIKQLEEIEDETDEIATLQFGLSTFTTTEDNKIIIPDYIKTLDMFTIKNYKYTLSSNSSTTTRRADATVKEIGYFGMLVELLKYAQRISSDLMPPNEFTYPT